MSDQPAASKWSLALCRGHALHNGATEDVHQLLTIIDQVADIPCLMGACPAMSMRDHDRLCGRCLVRKKLEAK